jgi:hypothetical protein
MAITASLTHPTALVNRSIERGIVLLAAGRWG